MLESGIPHTTQPAPPLNAFPKAAGTTRSSSPPIAATDPVFVAEPVEAADEGNVHGGPAAGSADVFAVDASGKIHVSDHVLLGDENDVFVNGLSHSDVPPVRAAPTFEAIAEWFAEDEESDVPVVVEPTVQVPAKRSSGGADSNKVKRARSSTPTSKEMHPTKAGMSSSKNSLAAVDKQPRRGK
ncbi:hypothetical protein V6N12_073774 [Hibiscus sabdariffa]|uniref:Uncharacterized protein n=1 Tax=Hibiscus sabdariffa TaxID=183260 RepID=A0ABR2CTW1_9ROSI